MNPIDRVKQEGLFHPLIDAGALTHVWLGEARPNAESIANFVDKTFRGRRTARSLFRPNSPPVPIAAGPRAGCTTSVPLQFGEY